MNQLGWQLGNGKRIHLWKDCSPLYDLLTDDQGFLDLANWMMEQGFTHLADISSWDDQGHWNSWKTLNLPRHLLHHWHSMLGHLKGFVPIATSKLDKRIWLGGKSKNYTVKEGYVVLIKKLHSPSLAQIWEKIWNKDGLPKVNILCWELVHEKILTAENLRKRNILGPSHYMFCGKAEESIKHLFCFCPFSVDTWKFSLLPIFQLFAIPNEWNMMFNLWRSQYPFPKKSSSLFMRSWMAVTKFLCWSIWLYQNQVIFQDKWRSPEFVVIKGMQLLFEVISSRGYDEEEIKDLSTKEKDWLKISKNSKSTSNQKKKNKVPSFCIRLSRENFEEWKRNIGKVQLLFKGATKGNPGEAGAGGMIFNLEKKYETKYAWGLGKASNNQAEALPLWQGLKISISKGIKKLIIVGDSLVVIKIA